MQIITNLWLTKLTRVSPVVGKARLKNISGSKCYIFMPTLGWITEVNPATLQTAQPYKKKNWESSWKSRQSSREAGHPVMGNIKHAQYNLFYQLKFLFYMTFLSGYFCNLHKWLALNHQEWSMTEFLKKCNNQVQKLWIKSRNWKWTKFLLHKK